MMRYLLIGIILLCSERASCQDFIDGITMVAPPNPVGEQELNNIVECNASWVAVVPYGFTRKGRTEVIYNSPRQWWGEKLEGTQESIRLAHEAGLKVMLKPQVYMPGSWVGEMTFETDAQWIEWEQSYSSFIMAFAQMAAEEDVAMLCMGTEYKLATKERPTYWKKLIAEIRSVYQGKLTYCANWDSYEDVSFWEDLDYIGISGYFPLTDKSLPSTKSLISKWKPITKKLKKYARKQKRKILFTEFGYQSVDGCAGKAWEIEKEVHERELNQDCQACAVDAFFSAHADQKYFAGAFLWKWFPGGMGHEGYIDKDYTPQNKKALTIIKKWYGESN